MKPRSDEEVAVAVWCERWGDTAAGSKPDETITEYEIALVAAGRAEGDKQGEVRVLLALLCDIEALTVTPGESADDFVVSVADRIRARLREIQP